MKREILLNEDLRKLQNCLGPGQPQKKETPSMTWRSNGASLQSFARALLEGSSPASLFYRIIKVIPNESRLISQIIGLV